MGVRRRYTWETLRKNRTRTVMTVIGILLSMALMTAVIEGAWSGLSFLRRGEEASEGTWEGVYADLSPEEVKTVTALPEVKRAAVLGLTGWARIGSKNECKPYLLIRPLEKGTEDLIGARLLSGRLPENETEILLPDHLAENGGVAFHEGDTLTLSVGRRVLPDGSEAGAAAGFQPGETLTEEESRTYTVVGFFTRPGLEVEPFQAAGYTALTRAGAAGNADVYFSLKDPHRFYRWLPTAPFSERLRTHWELLVFMGVLGGETSEFLTLFIGFTAVLLFLVALGSISLIYNAFSISVAERTRQFGILKSVGATGKQIRRCVLWEALTLAAIGIPAGLLTGLAGIGLTLRFLKDSFGALTMGTGAETVAMRLEISVPLLLAAALLCLLTTLAASLIPAGRALRVTPMEAVRQTNDVKIRPGTVRTSRLTEKFFGFEGTLAVKNFKRSRRGYRATIVSLFLSVTLFISTSSFCAYLTDNVRDVASGDIGADLVLPVRAEPVGDDLLREIRETDGVEEAVRESSVSSEMAVPDKLLSGEARAFFTEYRDSIPRTESGEIRLSVALTFIDDESFAAWAGRLGLSAEEFADPAAPKGVFADHMVVSVFDDAKGRVVRSVFNLFRKEGLPEGLGLRMEKEMPGYAQWGTETDSATGKEMYAYYPDEYLNSLGPEEEPDPANAVLIPEEETYAYAPLPVGAVTDERPYFLGAGRQQAAVVYPESVRESVLTNGGYGMSGSASVRVKAPAHRTAATALEDLLRARNYTSGRFYDYAQDMDGRRGLVRAVSVFAYGFIILISLIALANVFNTISTNVMLRRREIAMLRSVGMDGRGFRRMMNLECLIYGLRGLMWGLPASVLMTYLIWRITEEGGIDRAFYIPWYSVLTAVGSVFLVVFATMFYSLRVLRRENTLDALRADAV